jgi:hypothetical protein
MVELAEWEWVVLRVPVPAWAKTYTLWRESPMSQTSTIPEWPARTDNPCPPWCEAATGHGYDDATPVGADLRHHSAEVGRLTVGETTILVSIVADEYVRDGRNPVVCKPHITLHLDAVRISGWADLTGGDALSVSDILARAALTLQKIEGGGSL